MEATIPEFDRTGSQSDVKDRFYRYFQEACTGEISFYYVCEINSNFSELQERMAQLESYSLIGGERKDATDHLLAEISRLSNEVADLTGSVPAYDQRVYSQVSRVTVVRTVVNFIGYQSSPRETPRDSGKIRAKAKISIQNCP
jgi:hypothetical protein